MSGFHRFKWEAYPSLDRTEEEWIAVQRGSGSKRQGREEGVETVVKK